MIKKIIQYGSHEVDSSDINAVVRVLKNQHLTQGPEVDIFEEALTAYVGSSYAVACNSATSALHLACLALEICEHKLVWVPATSFVASSNCALFCNAKVDFVDINDETFNIDIKKLETKLLDAKNKNSLPDLIIVVHMSGHPADMQGINRLRKIYKFKIIEDASHAIGSQYKGNNIGSCVYSDITVFSFHPVKIITTGEGGAATTNSDRLYKKMKLLRSHGITRELDYKKRGSWEYDQILLGYNYRITDIQAALGRSQLNKVDKYVEMRNEIASIYNSRLQDLPLKIQKLDSDTYSSFHLYLIRFDLNKTKYDHNGCHSEMRKNGIFVNLHYRPIYLMPYYKKLDSKFKKGYCKISENYAKTAMTLPIHTTLKKTDINYVIENLKKLFK